MFLDSLIYKPTFSEGGLFSINKEPESTDQEIMDGSSGILFALIGLTHKMKSIERILLLNLKMKNLLILFFILIGFIACNKAPNGLPSVKFNSISAIDLQKQIQLDLIVKQVEVIRLTSDTYLIESKMI